MRTSYPKPMETMERITRQFLCDHFDEILERVDKEDIGFVILNEEGKDGEVLIPYRWTECFVDEDFGVVVNSALRHAIEKQSFMTAGVINFVRKNLKCLDIETIQLAIQDIEKKLKLGKTGDSSMWEKLKEDLQNRLTELAEQCKSE